MGVTRHTHIHYEQEEGTEAAGTGAQEARQASCIHVPPLVYCVPGPSPFVCRIGDNRSAFVLYLRRAGAGAVRGPPVSKKRRRQAAAEDLEKRQLAAKAKRKKAAEKSRSALVACSAE